MEFANWEPVIGLEIHAQLLTQSKIFSSDSTSFGAPDNENTTPTSVGLPGTLPVINEKVIEFGTKIGLALNCSIRRHSIFARKNYFYPDLPKGYQISQYEEPIAEHGYVEVRVDGELRKIGITRGHLEEDAGKSTHHGDHTLINLNRAGVPLMEIVTEPEIRTPLEAAEYARTVRKILRYLEVCDGNLEEGSLRCDCNVSVRPKGQKELGTKVEIKNINSFRFVEKALEYEIQRQVDVLEAGQSLVQETRLYDSAKNRTFSMRSKEQAADYRYFPDPDLPPLNITEKYIEDIAKTLPELPLQRQSRFEKEFGLNPQEGELLTQEKDMADYYEEVVKKSADPKLSAGWVTGELIRRLHEDSIEISQTKVSASSLAELLGLIKNKTISGKIAKSVFQKMWETGRGSEEIVEKEGLKQISDTGTIEKTIDEILAKNPGQVDEFRQGKEKVFGFFVGQVMKATKGQADPSAVNEILRKKLGGKK